MTRQEYMQQLAVLLAAMPEAERRDALDYYEEYFDAAGPEKEAQTIQELGSPQNVAEKIWEGTGVQFGTPMPDNSMPEQGSRRRKSPVWIVLAILAILIVVLLVFNGFFKIVTKYQYSIAESATAEEVPPQEATGEATENMDESTDENTETAITKESAKSKSTNRLESSTMTLDAKQVQTMVLDLDCGEIAFVRSNAADEITLRFENFYSDWLERTVDESGFSVRYKIPKGYISGSDPTPTLSIALPEIELEQIELNLNLGSADLGTLKAKSIQADLALGVRLSFVRFVPLQVSVVKLQRFDNKIRFLSFGNGFRNELGYPFITENRLFLLVWLFFLHNGLDNLVRQFSVLVKLFHFDSLRQ